MGLPLAAPQYGADYGLEDLHDRLESRLIFIKLALVNYQTIKRRQDLRLTRIQFASFLLMPIQNLELVSKTRSPYLVYSCFIAPEVFSNYCKYKRKTQKEDSVAHLFVKAGVTYYPRRDYDGFERERHQCLQRNNRTCMVTGRENPDVCHIVPPLMNSTSGDRRAVNRLAHYFYTMLGYDGKVIYRNFGVEVGCSDKQWNMLPLDPELHSLWRLARCGFKCIDYIPGNLIHPAKIRLQFHWLRTNWLHPKGTASATAAEVEEMTGIRSTTDMETTESSLRRRIKSGQVFVVNIETRVALKMKFAIDIQWVIVRIAALSGAAAYPKNLIPLSDPQSDYHASRSVLMEAENYATSREIIAYVPENMEDDTDETWEEEREVDEDPRSDGYSGYAETESIESYDDYEEYFQDEEDERTEVSINGSDSAGSPTVTPSQASRAVSTGARNEQASDFSWDFSR